jgi:hypothetical protein
VTTYSGYECDGCGKREENERGSYGSPPGWAKVSSRVDGATYLEAEGHYCGTCALAVDAVRLGTSRLMNPPKPKAKRKAKVEVEEEDLDELDPGE